jgi:hypothetical protein
MHPSQWARLANWLGIGQARWDKSDGESVMIYHLTFDTGYNQVTIEVQKGKQGYVITTIAVTNPLAWFVLFPLREQWKDIVHYGKTQRWSLIDIVRIP